MAIHTKILRSSLGQTLLEQLERKLNYLKVVKHNDCWELKLAKTKKGIQYIAIAGGRQFSSPRVSAAVYLGLNLYHDERLVLHKNECHNPSCWNPSHLYLGTYTDNIRDSIELGTHSSFNYPRKKQCSKGHPYTEDNTVTDAKRGRSCRECRRLASQKFRDKEKTK